MKIETTRKSISLFAMCGLLLALAACAKGPSGAPTGETIRMPEPVTVVTDQLDEPAANPELDEANLTPLQRRMARERSRFPAGTVPGARHEQFTEGLPTVWLIGDSTVKANRDRGELGQWGWGHEIGRYFDLTKINVENQALGGTSSRSFRTLGYWDEVLRLIQPGDYLMIQFGHNDGGIDSNTPRIRARGTLPGNGGETVTHEGGEGRPDETVHTYGWYLRQYIAEARAAGATPVVCSPIPRNRWRDGKVVRDGEESYSAWARQAAGQAGVAFINLNHIIADNMDEMSEEFSKGTLFAEREAVHTALLGAQLNALCVVQGVKALGENCKLNEYLQISAQPVEPAPEGLVAAGE